jgi:aminomethyltransferase
MKKTPLFENNKKLNADIIEFGSWYMPVKYSGIIEEHLNTRQKAGLFDTCHMGEITIKGKGAFNTVQKLIPRNAEKFKNNKCYYSQICNEAGGIIDDVVIFKFTDDEYLFVINSETYEKDYEWINENKEQETVVEDISLKTGKVDVQGPDSRNIVNLFLGEGQKVDELKFYSFNKYKWKNIDIIVSRTGYTGELGYEIYSPAENISDIWEDLLEKGKDFGIMPAGLGARDTLRLEMGYPLMGQDLDNKITPVEAGFGVLVDFEKEYFIGKQAMFNKIGKYKTPFIIERGGIARHNCEVFDKDNNLIGEVTSGTFSPSLKKAIGFAYCDKKLDIGEEVFFKVRERFIKGVVSKGPFVENTSLKN